MTFFSIDEYFYACIYRSFIRKNAGFIYDIYICVAWLQCNRAVDPVPGAERRD